MPARKAPITQTELTRYLRAYRDAGYPAPMTEVRPDGTVRVIPMEATAPATDNPCDRLLDAQK